MDNGYQIFTDKYEINYFINKIADNDHHKSNKFSRINIKSIYLFFKNDLKKIWNYPRI